MSHIELKDVSKTYRLSANTVTALHGFSVAIESGEVSVQSGNPEP